MSSIVYKLKKSRKQYYREITYSSKYKSLLKLEKHNITFQSSALNYIENLDILYIENPLDIHTGENGKYYSSLDSFIEEVYDPGAEAIEVKSSIYEPLVQLYKVYKEHNKGIEKEVKKRDLDFNTEANILDFNIETSFNNLDFNSLNFNKEDSKEKLDIIPETKTKDKKMAIKKVKIDYDSLPQRSSPEIKEVLELERDDILKALKKGKSYTAIAEELNKSYKNQFKTRERLVRVAGQTERVLKKVSASFTKKHIENLEKDSQ